jgi:hypothetical protein
MNVHQVSQVMLNPKVIDCIIFWTKDPAPMLTRLSGLHTYHYYFQFTLNAYPQAIEPNLLPLEQRINTFHQLADSIGSQRVIWRYDPILLTDELNEQFHFHQFDTIARKLQGYTQRCMISFIDMYKKCQRNMQHITLQKINNGQMLNLAGKLQRIASCYGITLQTCAEDIDLSSVGVGHGKCIDADLISEIIGTPLKVKKDRNQRRACGCASAIDIGAYNTCRHHCIYCYANYSWQRVVQNCREHDATSPLLVGHVTDEDVIQQRAMHSLLAFCDNWWDIPK